MTEHEPESNNNYILYIPLDTGEPYRIDLAAMVAPMRRGNFENASLTEPPANGVFRITHSEETPAKLEILGLHAGRDCATLEVRTSQETLRFRYHVDVIKQKPA